MDAVFLFSASLQQELDGHESYINSLCFDEEGTKLYSADNMGIIKIWNVYVTEKATKKGVTRDWQLNSTIDNEEMKVSCCSLYFIWIIHIPCHHIPEQSSNSIILVPYIHIRLMCPLITLTLLIACNVMMSELFAVL